MPADMWDGDDRKEDAEIRWMVSDGKTEENRNNTPRGHRRTPFCRAGDKCARATASSPTPPPPCPSATPSTSSSSPPSSSSPTASSSHLHRTPRQSTTRSPQSIRTSYVTQHLLLHSLPSMTAPTAIAYSSPS